MAFFISMNILINGRIYTPEYQLIGNRDMCKPVGCGTTRGFDR